MSDCEIKAMLSIDEFWILPSLDRVLLLLRVEVDENTSYRLSEVEI